MAWKVKSVMDQRREFVRLARTGEVSISELCRRFEISRQTGHLLLRRYAAQGEAGLEVRSRRPHASPRRTASAQEAQVLDLHDRHPAWGGRKLARRLRDLGEAAVPAASTVTDILRRHGKLDPAEAARHRAFVRFEWEQPNDLWQMDFKGHFPTESQRCHPLTVLDDCCRYSLALRACANETDLTVRGQLTEVFRRYGLPRRILADNGSPWGAPGGGYTALGVWLLCLDIELWHGRPRHPQTQGKDERFHRTLNVEVLQGRRLRGLPECQAAFDAWRPIYNEQRPHEALGMDTPASRYRPSPRSFPEVLPEPQYHADDVVRRVSRDGYVNLHGRRLKISQAFAGRHVALRPTTTDGLWAIYFARAEIARIDLNKTELLT